jgi:hypothetical protein
MSVRRAGTVIGLMAIVLGAIAFIWFRQPEPAAADIRVGAPNSSAHTSSRASAPAAAPVAEAVDPAFGGESRIADALNAPSGTIQRDLEILNELFVAWQSNFPRWGNPVGENADITAALAGANDLKFAFISPRHRAINANGELCDRWGKPFRFHQLSGRQMEIRSAGPDGKFGTADDAVWTPAQ